MKPKRKSGKSSSFFPNQQAMVPRVGAALRGSQSSDWEKLVTVGTEEVMRDPRRVSQPDSWEMPPGVEPTSRELLFLIHRAVIDVCYLTQELWECEEKVSKTSKTKWSIIQLER